MARNRGRLALLAFSAGRVALAGSPRGKVTQAMVYATSMHAATFAVMGAAPPRAMGVYLK